MEVLENNLSSRKTTKNTKAVDPQPLMDKKNPVIRSTKKSCERAIESGYFKSFPAMGKTCNNCNKPNHFAEMCRSQHVSERTEDSEKSQEECNLILGQAASSNSCQYSNTHQRGAILKIRQRENKGNKPKNEV